MKTLLSFTVPPDLWFSESPSNLDLRELRKTAIVVSGKRAWEKWGSAIDELPNPSDRDRLRELVSSMRMIADFNGLEVDFRVPSAPHIETLNDVINSPRYEELLDRRRASPHLEGENPDQGFERLFGFLLPWARDWQIIDHFLLEQLLSRRAVFDLLVRNLHLLPARTEIFSRVPRTQDGNMSALSDPQLMKNLFQRENRELEIVAYTPPSDPRTEKFPHPRLQKIRFDRGEVFTSLDNGLSSLAEKAPVVYAEVGNSEWTEARSWITAMTPVRVV
jgi:hypothetical protein